MTYTSWAQHVTLLKVAAAKKFHSIAMAKSVSLQYSDMISERKILILSLRLAYHRRDPRIALNPMDCRRRGYNA